MFQDGRLARACTTLGNGCLQLPVNSALRFGKGLLPALIISSCHEDMNIRLLNLGTFIFSFTKD